MKVTKSFDSSSPVFYLIATPIGNRADISLRALEILKEADFVACEDTRNGAKLLAMYDINKPLLSVREHNEVSRAHEIVERVTNGELGAYISDAGYPGISDPGEKLVQILLESDIAVSVIPGASAFISALVASGISSERFYFHGFLPPKKNARLKEIEQLKTREETLIIYESPHRVYESLNDLYKVLGNRSAVIARELTKLHEQYIRGQLRDLSQIEKGSLKGEIVLIIEGSHAGELRQFDEENILAKVSELISLGLSEKDATTYIAKYENISKNALRDLIYKTKVK